MIEHNNTYKLCFLRISMRKKDKVILDNPGGGSAFNVRVKKAGLLERGFELLTGQGAPDSFYYTPFSKSQEDPTTHFLVQSYIFECRHHDIIGIINVGPENVDAAKAKARKEAYEAAKTHGENISARGELEFQDLTSYSNSRERPVTAK
jgi:hypothetical protein